MSATKQLPPGVTILKGVDSSCESILSVGALEFLTKLHRKFEPRRQELLQKRKTRQKQIDAGQLPQFLKETEKIRQGDWKVAQVPADLQNRRVEITGPTDRKMMINALNSGANVFMADFEDANAPTWQNMVEGQRNLIEAIERTIEFVSPEGKGYKLAPKVATLLVRPRGWHLSEKHLQIDGQSISGSLFDFGLYFFHNAKRLLSKGTGPYFYLAKLENHEEARLWNDVFVFAQNELGIPQGTIKATVLLETILNAFHMDEVLYELREHSAGLNAGRWDYIFSIIKKFSRALDFVFPDRSQITMTVPFMRAYTELLVKTCHRRGAHAMGGMAAFIPSRKDAQVNEIAMKKVREDKEREAKDGFDGTWVAHPDLVTIAREEFDKVLKDRPHQKDRLRAEVKVTAEELRNFMIPGGQITEKGLRSNISIAILYLESWLRGTGAAALFNLMEDVATAEISRSQVWQWLHNPKAVLSDGRKITQALCHQLTQEELQKIKDLLGEKDFQKGKFKEAEEIFRKLVEKDEFTEFLTLVAYDFLE